MNDCLSAFETLYRTYYRRMVVYAGGFSAVPAHERTDLAHDILVHAWLKREQFRPRAGTDRSEEQKLNAWIYALARNFILDRIRANRLRTIPFVEEREAEPIARSKTPEEEAVSSDLLKSIRNAISAMSERDREIAQLVFYERMTAAETARVMGIPGATVRWRLAVMRKALRQTVEERS